MPFDGTNSTWNVENNLVLGFNPVVPRDISVVLFKLTNKNSPHFFSLA